MNFSELLTHLDNLQKDSETLNEVRRIVGGKKEDIITLWPNVRRLK